MVKRIKITKKNIIIASIIALIIVISSTQLIALSHKQQADSVHSEYAIWQKTLSNSENKSLVGLSVDDYQKTLDYYNKMLSDYKSSRQWSPFFATQDDIDQTNKTISNLEANIEISKKYDLFNTEMNTGDLTAAKAQIYSIIDFAQSKNIDNWSAYYSLATVLVAEQKDGDSPDSIFFALDKMTDLSSKGVTIKQMFTDKQYVSDLSNIHPRILNLYAQALINANRHSEAITILNQAIKNEDFLLPNTSEHTSYQAETYYMLSVSYWNTGQKAQAVTSIDKCLELAPDNANAQKYKAVLTLLMSQ